MMRSSRRAATAAAALLSVSAAAFAPMTAADAATKCPSGQILRVSKQICVPKADNLALLSPHRRSSPDPAPAAPRAPPEAKTPVVDEKAGDEAPVQVAERDLSARRGEGEVLQKEPSPPAALPPAVSPFGELFVGAFRSTVATGLSAAR